MDLETLQALINLYKSRASANLLSIIMDEAEGPRAHQTVLELLRLLSGEFLTNEEFAALRRKACRFCLAAEDFELAERLARGSDLPEDRLMRARALYELNRAQEAAAVYRQAVAKDPAIRNRELERLLGIRPGLTLSPVPAKIISLATYSRRESRGNQEPVDRDKPRQAGHFDEERVLTFAQIAGLDHIKTEIRHRIVQPYLKPSLFEQYRQKPGGNILLYGPPGCGKSLIARAIAGESDGRFLSISPEDIFDRYFAEAEKRLRSLFEEARSSTPAILFFDNFELFLAAGRSSGATSGLSGAIAVLLDELNGAIHDNGGILVVAATNAPWELDPSLLEAWIFNRALYAPPPALKARLSILGQSIANVPGHDKVALDKVAQKTAGFSGSGLWALSDWVCYAALTKALAGVPHAGLS